MKTFASQIYDAVRLGKLSQPFNAFLSGEQTARSRLQCHLPPLVADVQESQ
jgi:hypothetical protein